MDDNFSFQISKVLGEILDTKHIYKQQLAYGWQYISAINKINLFHLTFMNNFLWGMYSASYWGYRSG